MKPRRFRQRAPLTRGWPLGTFSRRDQLASGKYQASDNPDEAAAARVRRNLMQRIGALKRAMSVTAAGMPCSAAASRDIEASDIERPACAGQSKPIGGSYPDGSRRLRFSRR
jgi:hypothetical protein